MKYGLIGQSINYSYSKIIHQELFDAPYEIVNLSYNELAPFIKQKDFHGINVTTPYKQVVTGLVDELSKCAVICGSVNTIVKRDDKLVGYNTDFLGFKSMLEYYGINVKGKQVVILGDGGASKAVQKYCTIFGAKISVVSRSNERINLDYQQFTTLKKIDILINATPVGTYPGFLLNLVDLKNLKAKPKVVIDLIYNPSRTKLLMQAEELKIPAYNGLIMLIAQAIAAQEVFGNQMNSTLLKINYLLKQKTNIVLIGMPTSGKTTIGKLLAKALNREFIDSDEEIEKKYQLSCKDIIEKKGLVHFRAIEKEIIDELSLKNELVIATGGGVIEDIDNINMLKANGRCYWLNRPLELLSYSEKHPLSNDFESLRKLYNQRFSIYQKLSDVKIDNTDDIEKIIDIIKEDFNEYCSN